MERRVETSSPPEGTRTWLQAAGAASYEDENSDLQTIELVHWIMALSDEQLAAMALESSMPMEVEDALNHLNSDAATLVTEADRPAGVG